MQSSQPSSRQIISQQSVIWHEKRCYLLFDPSAIDPPSASLLNNELLQQADEVELIASGGRGQAWFVKMAGLSLVYRAYLRGGLMAKINKQSYFGFNIENSRSFKEWRLLQWMHAEGLPVPRPIAASICRQLSSVSPLYRAHILIERIDDVKTLDELLNQSQLDNSVWSALGHSIRLFHDKGIYHADLNAHNILLDMNKKAYLIDFDKGERRNVEANVKWKQDNLRRLKRSLLKQQGLHENYYFSTDAWAELEIGYKR